MMITGKMNELAIWTNICRVNREALCSIPGMKIELVMELNPGTSLFTLQTCYYIASALRPCVILMQYLKNGLRLRDAWMTQFIRSLRNKFIIGPRIYINPSSEI